MAPGINLNPKNWPLNSPMYPLAECQSLQDYSRVIGRTDASSFLFHRYALVHRRPDESAIDTNQLVHRALRKRLQVQGQLGHTYYLMFHSVSHPSLTKPFNLLLNAPRGGGHRGGRGDFRGDRRDGVRGRGGRTEYGGSG
jgi:hypothetical protein